MDRIGYMKFPLHFELGPPGNKVPFGVVRVAVDTPFCKRTITPAVRQWALLAMISVGISVLLGGFGQPAFSSSVEKHNRGSWNRISKGEFDQKRLRAEMNLARSARKSARLACNFAACGRFSAPCARTFDQVLGGLDDGMLLFLA